MKTLRWFVGVALLFGTAIAALAFVQSNGDEVRVELLIVPPIRQPLWLVIGVAFLAGAFAASAGLLFQLGRKSLAMRRSEKRVRALEAELRKLRSASAPIAAGGDAPPIQPGP
jgi:uncharacterized integral membrane protein